MSPAPKERVQQVRATIREVLADRASDVFLGRIDKILEEWATDKLTAPQACEKVQKAVGLFIGEDLAAEIGNRCAPIVMRETAGKK